MGRLEHLLMRVHDGVATPEEGVEFEAMGGADAAREWASVRAQLGAAVLGSVDVADDVMELLVEPAYAADLRAGLMVPIDVSDAVMEALSDLPGMERMAFADGESDPSRRAEQANRFLRDGDARAAMAEQAQLGSELRAALAVDAGIDVWGAIAGSIGADGDEADVPGWNQTAAVLREAVGARSAIDLADAVMARVAPPVRRPVPMWASLGIPAGLMAAAAAALIALVTGGPPSGPDYTADVRHTVGIDLLLASTNDARVEDIQTAGDLVAQVVRFDDDGPTFIILDDPDDAPAVDSPGAPL